MIINLPNVAALIRAVSTVNPGNVAAVERIAADRPIDVGDLSALDAAAADALADGAAFERADLDKAQEDLDVARADLEAIDAALGITGGPSEDLAALVKEAVDGAGDFEAIAGKLDLKGLDEIIDWIDVANSKIGIVEALEKTIKDLEMERDAAVDAAVAAVEAAEAARKC